MIQENIFMRIQCASLYHRTVFTTQNMSNDGIVSYPSIGGTRATKFAAPITGVGLIHFASFESH